MFALNVWGIRQLTDNAVSVLCRSLPALTSLTICDCPNLTEQSLISVIAMTPKVHTLNMWGCTAVTAAAIQLFIRHTPQLQNFGLSFCPGITDSALANMSKLSELKSLQFESCAQITDKSLAGIASNNILTINLRRCPKLTSVGIEECVKNCPSVQTLNLAQCNLTTQSVYNMILASRNLRSLDLSGMKELDDATLLLITKSELQSKMVSIKLDECLEISNTAVQQIFANCTNLQVISLCFCKQLTDDSFNTLSPRNYSLTSISLGGCGSFTNTTIEKIAQCCPKLKDLVIPVCGDIVINNLFSGTKT